MSVSETVRKKEELDGYASEELVCAHGKFQGKPTVSHVCVEGSSTEAEDV